MSNYFHSKGTETILSGWASWGIRQAITAHKPYVSNKMCTLIFHIIFYCLPLRSTWVHRRLTRSLVLCVMFCRSLFVLLPIVFWPLRCPSFFDLRILITPLVSSNSSYYRPIYCCMSIFCFRYFKHTLTLY